MGVQITFRLPVTFRDEGNHFVACCIPLDIVTQGADRERAMHNIREAVSLFIESCMDRGTLDDVLKACGWTDIHAIDEIDDQQDTIDVPFELVANAKNKAGPLAHAS